ncbi:RHS repeat-associated protein [Ereboglobus sp. PH5-5]|uniref:hypothetical protein n=1 Tax=Ereboglobus sp. PH5-5 TaxID=2940529 RepID=UPI002404AC85|nr:hypothetical protein [Ereboglobus sp. PH5-5]MDF9834023.1 RHS repeat-associated protein [Ereboglobus sp. PH5-5]
MIHDRTIPASTQTYLPVRDASGSVTALVRDDGNSTTIVAVYEYDPNGNLLRAQGEYAKKNPFTFGGGWMDWETGLVSAGSVYYSARLGRYINSGPSGAGDGISACFGVDPSINYHHTRQYARPSSRRNTSTPSWQSVNPAELAAYEAAWTAYETARVAYEQAAEAESMALDGERSHNPDCESPEDNTADEFIADEHDYHQNAVFNSRDHGLSNAYLIGTDHREGGAYIEYYSDGSMLVTNTLGSTLLIENDGTATLNFSAAQLEIMQAPDSVTMAGGGTSKIPTSGSGWGSVMIVYDGKEKADPNNPKHATGAQLKTLATKTVTDPKYAIDAQSGFIASALATESGINTHSVKYVVVLDHGDENWYGGMRQQLGDRLLTADDIKSLSIYVERGGAIVLFGCSAGDSGRYLQSMANEAGVRVYGFPFTVELKKDQALPSPAADWPYRDPVRKGP